MRIACWIPTATGTRSEYWVLVALKLQQWLHERAIMLCYTYSASPVMNRNIRTAVPQAISGFDSRYEKDFLFPKLPDRLRNKPCLYSVGISPGVKRPGHEADQ